MSTKIYNAIKFNAGMSLSDVVSWANAIRPQVQQTVYDRQIKKITSVAVNSFDRYTLSLLGWSAEQFPHFSNSLSHAFNEIEEMAKLGARADETKPDAELVLFPHKRSVYAMVYLNELSLKEFTAAFGSVFSEFDYWDNTDRPEDITARQWRARKEVWDDIFKDSSRPVEVGVRVQLSRENSFFMNNYKFRDALRNDEVLRTTPVHLPSVTERLINMGSHITAAPWIPQVNKDSSVSAYMTMVRHMREGKIESFNTAQEFLREHVLDTTLTYEVLLKNTEELKEYLAPVEDKLRNLDIPPALLTPMFEKKRLEENIPDTAVSKPKMKM